MEIKTLKDNQELMQQSANWFHSKWGIPLKAYEESIEDSFITKTGVPRWYVVLDDADKIIAGAGIIENDFHNRKDLAPNLCALFVENENRGKGIAKAILDFARKDLASLGFDTLYLITDHTNFYEKCGWDFLTTVTEDSGTTARMYVAKTTI